MIWQSQTFTNFFLQVMEFHMNEQDIFYGDVGRRIRQTREERGMTQEGLASLVMLTRTSITNIEKGRQKLLLHTLVNIASALQVPPADLIPPVLSTSEQELNTLLKGRSRKEKEWIKSVITLSREDQNNDR
jgi:transcriptional regulator with XRE-family HTH domain